MSLNELKTMQVFDKTRTMQVFDKTRTMPVFGKTCTILPVFDKTCPTETIISFGKPIIAPRQPSGDGKKFPIDIRPMVSG
jgi:hypothetical protein